jgi:predicted nucleic acid-binding protein
MGLVLDSGVLISAERKATPVSTLLIALEREHGETELILSAITVIELEHGLHRSSTAEIARTRRAYLNTVFAAIPGEPFTREMGQLAAKVDAESKRAGRVIPFADLLIGVTALYLDYAVGTSNLRHFQMVPPSSTGALNPDIAVWCSLGIVRKFFSASWLGGRDLNPDTQIQSLQSYH